MSDNFIASSETISLGKSTEKINQLAGQLARLLQQTDEFNELVRIVSLLNQDPAVNRIMFQIRRLESNYEEGASIEELENQLKALPAYQAYVRSENALRDLFFSTNKVISQAAGLDFASNARRSTCSCGS